VHTLKATSQPEFLLQRVAALLDTGHASAAQALLGAARRLTPSSPRLAELSARLAMNQGRLEQARQELDAAIADAPEHAALRKLRAEVRRLLDDCPGAVADAAEAVVLDPADPVAKALLGVLLLDLQRPADAVACLREAVAAQPSNPGFRQGLSAALEAAGDPEAALSVLTDGISTAPGHVGLRNAAVLHCVRRRDFSGAVRLAEEARIAGAMDACLFGLKGHALSSLARYDEAAEAYSEALKLGPEDLYVRHLASASGAVPGADRAPADYLRAVFDGYAERFDAHLIALGYRVPGLLRAAALQHPVLAANSQCGPVLDLGCGTGLLAVALSDLPVPPLVGIDVSHEMLARAATKNLYTELQEADAVDFLRDDARHWQLILAADVLCYFGALDDLFAAVHARSLPGGWFIFSCEIVQQDHGGVVPGNGDWSLGRQGRYAHTDAYVTRTAIAAGFLVKRATPEVLRREADAPVHGLVVVLERPVDDN